ncbi:MAG: AmmeMemoRadiSam system protein B [Lentisphaerae bacterium]|nr:AmmeMemoRadiSam system protein B [Lentisphaerota bacterium]
MNAAPARPAAVAGTFYSENPAELRSDVEAYLAAVTATPPAGEVLAILVPHAGYRYSAAVAAHGYKALEGSSFDTAVIIGHDAHARGLVAILSDAEAFETPLGPVAVDRDLVAGLVEENQSIVVHNEVHRRDHTIEVQLPFLQVVLPDCRIVPVLFGEPNPATCRAFAEAILRRRGSRRLVVIASTDLTHYPTGETSARVDHDTMYRVAAQDLPALFTHLKDAVRHGADDNIQTAMCASGGVGTALEVARAGGPVAVKVLHQANSGAVPGGDTRRVVGYAAAVITRADAATADATVAEATAAAPAPAATAAEPEPAEPVEPAFTVAPEVRRALLALARRRITAAVRRESWEAPPPAELAEAVGQPAAVFVTLHRQGRLRGCIGMTEARLPLWQAVQDMAFSAAFKDWRFTPLGLEELHEISIEISVLSPLTEVPSADAVRPRHHGVVIRRDGRSGLFLPQVWEQIPEKDAFLSVLCKEKAGLPADAWKDPATTLLVFTVVAFSEP